MPRVSWRLPLTFTALLAACSATPDDGTSTLPDDGGRINVGGASSGTTGGSGPGTGGSTPGSGGTGISVAGTTGIGSGATGSGGLQGGTQCAGLGSQLKGLLRDFTPQSNPDFEPQLGPKGASAVARDDRGLVKATIDPVTMKPEYAGPMTGTATTYGPTSFQSWFRDTPGVNMSLEYTLEFVGPDANGIYTFEASPFLPIDDGVNCPTTPQTPCLMGNTVIPTTPPTEYPANYSLTFELHTNFVYKPGMRFKFSGDDDVFVYIDNALVIDLGGIHKAQAAEVALDTLGLVANQTYRLDFFWAERHMSQSNFRIDTSLEFIDCGLEPVR